MVVCNLYKNFVISQRNFEAVCVLLVDRKVEAIVVNSFDDIMTIE
jgi:hypothetical protein